MVAKNYIPIQSLLIQNTGEESLPITVLDPNHFLNFLRQIEKFSLENELKPLIIYWSLNDARRLLPDKNDYEKLKASATYIGHFSANNSSYIDEWGYILISPGLCLAVNGVEISEEEQASKYECSGSLNTQIVETVFIRLANNLESIDPIQYKNLMDAKGDLPFCGTSPGFIRGLKSMWPKVLPKVALNIQEVDSLESLDSINLGSDSGNNIALSVKSPNGNNSVIIDNISNQEFLIDTNEKLVSFKNKQSKEFQVSKSKSKTSDVVSNKPKIYIDKGESSVIPDVTQDIYKQILKNLKQTDDFKSVLNTAIEKLTASLKADRGLLWLIDEENISVECEYSVSGGNCFENIPIPADESKEFIKAIINYYHHEEDQDIAIIIENLAQIQKENRLYKNCSSIQTLFELGDVGSVLIARLTSRNRVLGFLELHQCKTSRQWSESDGQIVTSVAKMVSIVVQQWLTQKEIEERAKEMELLKNIGDKFRSYRTQVAKNSEISLNQIFGECVDLVKEHFGFDNAQLYLFDANEQMLVRQISNSPLKDISVNLVDNPFVTVFKNQKPKFYNLDERQHKNDPIFDNTFAWLMPLITEGETLGVLGLWELDKKKHIYSIMNRQKMQVAENITDNFASVIRADQSISLIEAHQKRSDLINQISFDIKEFNKTLNDTVLIKESFQKLTRKILDTFKTHFDLKIAMLALDSQVNIVDNRVIFNNSDDDQSLTLVHSDCQQIFEAIMNSHSQNIHEGKLVELKTDEVSGLGLFNQDNLDFGCVKVIPIIQENYKGSLFLAFNKSKVLKADVDLIIEIAERLAAAVSNAQTFIIIERQAITDPMTGLHNRRYFNEKLELEVSRSIRSGREFSFIIVDLDFLKKINDTLGHQFGDAAIIHISKVIQNCIRNDVDVVGRFGGEEFTILLPETDYQAGLAVASRICEAIREVPVDGIGTVTASLGLAVFPKDADNSHRLFEEADKALYLAKKRGRNQVCTASQSGDIEIINEDSKPSATLIIPSEPIDSNIDLKTFAEDGIIAICNKIIEMVNRLDSYDSTRNSRAYDYAMSMAKALKLSDEHSKILSLSSSLCNLGKLKIPEDILNKTGPLTEEEIKIIQESPNIGANLLEPAKLIYKVAVIIQFYRENFDGSGYPKGIKGEQIPLESRIISIIDAYTAMTSKRPYRDCMSHEEALNIITKNAGTQFDPRLVKIFSAVIQRMKT